MASGDSGRLEEPVDVEDKAEPAEARTAVGAKDRGDCDLSVAEQRPSAPVNPPARDWA